MHDSDSPQRTVSGLLDVRDKAAFLRADYLPGPADQRIAPGLVKQHGLRGGDQVVGTAGLAQVRSVNGASAWRERPRFADLTPVHPLERIRLETTSPATRVIDLFTPVGKGQRGLIVAPPKAGKTLILQDIAAAISVNHPECHLMVV